MQIPPMMMPMQIPGGFVDTDTLGVGVGVGVGLAGGEPDGDGFGAGECEPGCDDDPPVCGRGEPDPIRDGAA